MWIVKTHAPEGTAVESFQTKAEALTAERRALARGLPVTLDPTGRGLPLPRWCSFCGKRQEAVRRLCAGPGGAGVAICDLCVALISEIFAEETFGAAGD